MCIRMRNNYITRVYAKKKSKTLKQNNKQNINNSNFKQSL